MRREVLAFYMRLSLEDRAKGLTTDESNSIQSQRLILQNYVLEHPELAEMKVEEYIDDGYTGTNFDRPQVKIMLDKIKRGEIRAVIVKDLSRFGRNYIEVGDYLEHIFPFLNVRFIAVSDNYDSDNFLGSTGGIDLAIKNFMHQRYSQELSIKVKASMHMLMAKGQYVSHCPYGYTKEPGIKHRMVPDPVTAPIVKKIFKMAISGKKTTEIARYLNRVGVPTPLEHKDWQRPDITNKTMWSHQAVLRIIQDYKYTGAMVTFKCENLTIRAKAQHRRKPSEYVVIEDMHEPIVTHEEYYAANDSLRKVKVSSTSVRGDCKDRVYFCGHCGRRLRKTFGTDEYFSCATQMYIKGASCSVIRLTKSKIEKALLDIYRAQWEFVLEQYEELPSETAQDPKEDLYRDIQELADRIQNLEQEIFGLYERYRSGEYDRNGYLEHKKDKTRQKDLYLEQKKKKETQLELLHADSISKQEEQSLYDDAKDHVEMTDEELLQSMYDQIEKVVVLDNENIFIQWKFKRFFDSSAKI